MKAPERGEVGGPFTRTAWPSAHASQRVRASQDAQTSRIRTTRRDENHDGVTSWWSGPLQSHIVVVRRLAQRDGYGRSELAGALAEAFGVQDEYRTGRDLQPATGGEVRQRLVDRLPRGSDQLSQFLLGQVVMDVQPVAFLLAEA